MPRTGREYATCRRCKGSRVDPEEDGLCGRCHGTAQEPENIAVDVDRLCERAAREFAGEHARATRRKVIPFERGGTVPKRARQLTPSNAPTPARALDAASVFFAVAYLFVYGLGVLTGWWAAR